MNNKGTEMNELVSMSKERYHTLVANAELILTSEEIANDWHWCLNWDGMLIHSSWKEMSVSSCLVHNKENQQ